MKEARDKKSSKEDNQRYDSKQLYSFDYFPHDDCFEEKNCYDS